jgi:hypothetical protein
VRAVTRSTACGFARGCDDYVVNATYYERADR